MRLAAVVTVLSLAASPSIAAACLYGDIPETPVPTGRLPPNPTIYVEAYRRVSAQELGLEVRDQDGPVAVTLRPRTVGDYTLFAIDIPRTSGELDITLNDQSIGVHRIEPAWRPWSAARIERFHDLHGIQMLRHVMLSGEGVGYWEVATPGCGVSTVVATRDDRQHADRDLGWWCFEGGAVAVTAHYLDGTSQRVTTPVSPFDTTPASVSGWTALAARGAIAAIGALGLAFVLGRRRRTTAIV